MTQAAHVFDDALALTVLGAAGEGRYAGRTTPAYANMVGPFGGITAAIMLQAALQHPAWAGEPLALTVNFAGPVADGPFAVSAVPTRTNRSTQHWSVQLTQAGQVATTASAVFGTRRDTWTGSETPAPGVPPAPTLAPLPEQVPVDWLRSYDIRFVDGGFSEREVADDSVTTMWLRDEPPRPLDFPSLVARCDAFFPRIFLRRGPVAAGTVTFTVYFHVGAEQLAAVGSSYVLGRAQGLNFGRSFFDQSAVLWDEAGDVLATSHQLVYFKG